LGSGLSSHADGRKGEEGEQLLYAWEFDGYIGGILKLTLGSLQ